MNEFIPTLQSIQNKNTPAHLAIGIFDGVHLGHQAVINKAIEAGKKDNLLSGVLTFSPHPSKLFRPETATQLIVPLEFKHQLLIKLGVDTVICEPFTKELADLQASEFLPYLKHHLPGLKAIYVGENFRFGKQRLGDPEKMEIWGRELNLQVNSIPRILFEGTTISSTAIREMLIKGHIENANQLLGYNYFTQGTTQLGKRLGRKIGFPTLNLIWEPELKPRLGVYLVRVMDSKKRTRNAIANYGLRPSINTQQTKPLLEVHVLEECPWKHGDFLTVEWLKFVRPEQKFDSLKQLSAQIKCDCDFAKNSNFKV